MRSPNKVSTIPLRSPSPDLTNRNRITSTQSPNVRSKSPQISTLERNKLNNYEEQYYELKQKYNYLMDCNIELKRSLQALYSKECPTCSKYQLILQQLSHQNQRILNNFKPHHLNQTKVMFNKTAEDMLAKYKNSADRILLDLNKRIIELENKSKQMSPSKHSNFAMERSTIKKQTEYYGTYDQKQIIRLKDKIETIQIQLQKQIQKNLNLNHIFQEEKQRQKNIYKNCLKCMQKNQQNDIIKYNLAESKRKIHLFQAKLQRYHQLMNIKKQGEVTMDLVQRILIGKNSLFNTDNTNQIINRISNMQKSISSTLNDQN